MGRLGDLLSAGCFGMYSLERMCLCSQGVWVWLMTGPGHLDLKHTGQVCVMTPLLLPEHILPRLPWCDPAKLGGLMNNVGIEVVIRYKMVIT